MGEELNHTTARKSSLLYSKSLNYLCPTCSESSLSGRSENAEFKSQKLCPLGEDGKFRFNFFGGTMWRVKLCVLRNLSCRVKLGTLTIQESETVRIL